MKKLYKKMQSNTYMRYMSRSTLMQQPTNQCMTLLAHISKEWKTVCPALLLRLIILKRTSGDESALKQWRIWREHSIEKYKEEYARLNVSFDVYLGESLVSAEYMDTAIKKLEDMDLVSDSENGAKVIDLEKNKLGKAVVRKKGKLSKLSEICVIDPTLQMERHYTSRVILAELFNDTTSTTLTR